MLKPWIVQFLLWSLRGAMLAVPILLVWFRCFGRGYTTAAVATIAALYFVAWSIGLFLDFGTTLLTYTVLAALLLGVLMFIDQRRPATLLLLLPLGAACAYIVPIYADILDDKSNPLVPFCEHRLSPGLLCRGYPKLDDSMLESRLVLLRETPGLKDGVVAELEGFDAYDRMTCVVLPDGRVDMRTRSLEGSERHKLVTVND